MSKPIHILDEAGGIIAFAPEAITETMKDRLTKGYLKRVNADGTPFVEKSERAQPKTTDSKAEWVGWAVHISQSTDSPITPDDAEALTKQDLIEMYGVSSPKK